MARTKKPESFRTIIVGGGITGLTLANALQHAGVDFLVLESRSEIAPQVGASLGLAPNGSRILDQLSCYEEIEKLAEPIQSVGLHAANGNDLCPRSDSFQLFRARTNYSLCFLDRQKVVQSLAQHVHNQQRILLNKKVTKIDHSPDGVTVHCADGTLYCGDIVAGADGTRSKVQQEMWRAGEAADPRAISPEERNAMSAEYKCVFGISSCLPQLPVGQLDITHGKGVSTLVITGKGGRIFWFLFVRMPQIYKASNIPRFTKTEADILAQEHLDLSILPEGIVKFGDIWERRITSHLLALEEADYKTWTWGRFACVGDSVHKMTPNSGSGGMAAIESAAALANAIHSLVTGCESPTLHDIQRALARFQDSRKSRASATIEAANELTRIQTLKGFKERVIAHFGIPYGGDYLADTICETWIGATLLDFLPPPPRSLDANMSLNPPQSLEKNGNKLRRATVALPFLVMSIACFCILIRLIPFEELGLMLHSRKIVWGKSSSFPIWEKFYHVAILDDLARPATVLFSSSTFAYDPVSWFQMFTFLADIGVVYAIALVESNRRASIMTPIRFPFIFGMASFRGIGVIMPFYYFLHYVMSPIANFNAADKRLTDIAYTMSVLPVMLVGFYVPYFLAYLAPSLDLRHAGIWLWHMFPIWVSLAQWILAQTVMPNSIQYDRIHRVTRDLWTIRVTIGTLAALSGIVYIYSVLSAPFTLQTLFFPSGDELGTFKGAIQEFLKWDQIFFAVSSILWIVYLFADLNEVGIVTQNWMTTLGILSAVSLLFGTGAATAFGWLWREEILVSRKPKNAVITGWEARKRNFRLPSKAATR